MNIKINNLFNYMNYKDNPQILDPLSSLIKLALLNFKNKGTKLSIYNNSIHFQEPSILQGSIRLYTGDNRNNLHNLGKPLQRVTEWYNPNITKCLKLIYKKAVDGLDILIDTYSSINNTSLIIYTITYYKDILNNILENKDNIYNNNLSSSIPLIDKNNDVNIENTFNNIWDIDEIEVINKLFILIINNKTNNKDYLYLIKSIETILEGKDNIIRDMIYNKITTI